MAMKKNPLSTEQSISVLTQLHEQGWDHPPETTMDIMDAITEINNEITEAVYSTTPKERKQLEMFRRLYDPKNAHLFTAEYVDKMLGNNDD